jgi:hypothetical protein
LESILIAKVVATRLASLCILLGSSLSVGASPATEHVVLLHGLARSASSMSDLAEALSAAGYRVCNVEYPSREHGIAELANDFVLPAVKRCVPDSREKVHFVTHSLGGIVVRQLFAAHALPNAGRVVMLSPPNHGSEVVDKLGNLQLFEWVNGPAGQELSTQPHATPLRLGPADFELGIITGTSSINPILSMMIPGEDDGKVAVKNAQLAGMKDFLVVRCSHPLIMKSGRVIAQTVRFLQQGAFEHHKNAHGAESPGNCWS